MRRPLASKRDEQFAFLLDEQPRSEGEPTQRRDDAACRHGKKQPRVRVLCPEQHANLTRDANEEHDGRDCKRAAVRLEIASEGLDGFQRLLRNGRQAHFQITEATSMSTMTAMNEPCANSENPTEATKTIAEKARSQRASSCDMLPA